ncbi:MAG TPA: valine--tRNA ligase [Nitrolancea sp.]|nr:valine--tRNA ligase [Nitrolancea sp.]
MTTSTSGELAKNYDPTTIEGPWYDRWYDNGYFTAKVEPGQKPFVVIMPPPNVTGELHMGHALFVAVEDILARWHRMHGTPTLWLPGADHAGIAGQWVVERELAKKGLTRQELGREAFLDNVWEWMDRYRKRILSQLRTLGASSDWSRFHFTMDPGPSRAVRTAFKRLYDKGLIYRGERLINWCPRCMTALSDLEVDHEEVVGSIWTLRYPITGSDEYIEVATTRPETMLGDSAVAVHPDDERYRHLVGRFATLPILGRQLPIVADDAVDPTFGTGAVKVTPAHDPNDFDIGQRHNLAAINVMNLDGTMNDAAGPFAGQTTQDARTNVVARLGEEGFLVEVKEHTHAVGRCQRCGTIVEPMISKQWFIEMQPLAEPAIEVAKDGTVRFVPERFKGTYLHWMENIHDWCISRQLWWGHRIPVWYCDCGEVVVTDEEKLERCPHCGGSNLTQDPDVLDTWFSSGLWTFSTLGWPDDTEDLHYFYPGSVMETGYDILFFWVARMIFFGIEFMGEAPFHTVYLHGTVRDELGQRMSKTKGNVIDPTVITQEFGSDALRFTLITAGAPGADMKLSEQRVESNRNFGTKIWNATRFVLRALDSGSIAQAEDGTPVAPDADAMTLSDLWILSKLERLTSDIEELFANYQLGEAGRRIYEFLWSEYCDWYIESTKVVLNGDDEAAKATTRQTLAYVLERSLRLLHPFMPFLTEELWQHMPHAGESIMIADWPVPDESRIDERAVAEYEFMIEAVRAVRNARAESGVEAGAWISAMVYPGSHAETFASLEPVFSFLARVGKGRFEYREAQLEAPQAVVTLVIDDAIIYLPLAGMVDIDAERERLTKEIEQVEEEIARTGQLLSNENFTNRAPADVVNRQRERLSSAQERLALLQARLGELGA